MASLSNETERLPSLTDFLSENLNEREEWLELLKGVKKSYEDNGDPTLLVQSATEILQNIEWSQVYCDAITVTRNMIPYIENEELLVGIARGYGKVSNAESYLEIKKFAKFICENFASGSEIETIAERLQLITSEECYNTIRALYYENRMGIYIRNVDGQRSIFYFLDWANEIADTVDDTIEKYTTQSWYAEAKRSFVDTPEAKSLYRAVLMKDWLRALLIDYESDDYDDNSIVTKTQLETAFQGRDLPFDADYGDFLHVDFLRAPALLREQDVGMEEMEVSST